MDNFNQQLISILSQPGVAAFILVWSLFWKGRALWRAASNKHFWWFVILLVLNTLGLLEIAYIFYFHKRDIDKGRTLRFLEEKLGKKPHGNN